MVIFKLNIDPINLDMWFKNRIETNFSCTRDVCVITTFYFLDFLLFFVLVAFFLGGGVFSFTIKHVRVGLDLWLSL